MILAELHDDLEEGLFLGHGDVLGYGHDGAVDMPVFALEESVHGELTFLTYREPRPVMGADLHLDLHPGVAVDGTYLAALLELDPLLEVHIQVHLPRGCGPDGILG